jgi:hypothetical protein
MIRLWRRHEVRKGHTCRLPKAWNLSIRVLGPAGPPNDGFLLEDLDLQAASDQRPPRICPLCCQVSMHRCLTCNPCRANKFAATSPLWPAPTIITSVPLPEGHVDRCNALETWLRHVRLASRKAPSMSEAQQRSGIRIHEFSRSIRGHAETRIIWGPSTLHSQNPHSRHRPHSEEISHPRIWQHPTSL